MVSFWDKLRGRQETTLSGATTGTDPKTTRYEAETHRIPKDKLEAAYKDCPLVNQGINKFVQIIMSGNPHLECEDKNILQFYEDFLDNIGYVGGNTNWREILYRTFLDGCIYGSAWIEKMYNKKGNIADLDIIDAKTMDYAKSGQSIALDEYGMPLGYVQKVPYGRHSDNIKPPKEITITGNEKYIPKEYIAQIPLYNFGDGLKPIGLIEPCFNDVSTYLELKKAYRKNAMSVLWPTRVAKVGDDKHEPNQEVLEDMIKNLQEARYDTEISTPNYVDLYILEAKHPDALLNFLTFFREEIIISLGLPKPFVTGLGEETNRSTLNIQTELTIIATLDIIRRICRHIEDKIFRQIAEEQGFKKEGKLIYPKIEWDLDRVFETIKTASNPPNPNPPKGDEDEDNREPV